MSRSIFMTIVCHEIKVSGSSRQKYSENSTFTGDTKNEDPTAKKRILIIFLKNECFSKFTRIVHNKGLNSNSSKER